MVNSLSGGSGTGTLRWAIDQANADANFDTIRFDDADGGTIFLSVKLPDITTPILFDGATHPDYESGVPAITVDGPGSSDPSSGFHFDFDTVGQGSSIVGVKGLGITGFSDDGILISDLPGPYSMDIRENHIFTNGDDGVSVATNATFGTLLIELNQITSHTTAFAPNGANGIEILNAPISVVIEGNRIGTDGTSDLGNRDAGILIDGDADVTIRADSTTGESNIISGNNGHGIHARNLSEPLNISESIIGLDATGTYAIGNISYGVVIENASGASMFGNLVGGNGGGGIQLDNVDNVEIGDLSNTNFIGLTGSLADVGNLGHGIELRGGTNNTRIVGNAIAFNSGDGVSLLGDGLSAPERAGNNNRISSNFIFDNGGLGIDLNNDGVTLNDPNDLDTNLPNNGLNFPEMSINRVDGTVWYIDVAYASRSTYGNHKFDFEFFRSFDADESEHGEGLAPAGKVQTTLDASGVATPFTQTVTVSTGQSTFLSALAIDRDTSGMAIYGDTSEFAKNVSLIQGDLNQDGVVTLEDLSILVGNYGISSSVTWYDGDLNNDDKVNVKDLIILRNNCDCTGGESLMGGGLNEGAVDELFGESGGGGEALLSGDPARIYITTSGSTSGGGALPGSVPSLQLSGPTDSVTLYVWANVGGYAFMNGYGLDIRATNDDVVKATASTLYNANIVASNYGNAVVGVRWDGNLTPPTLNADGVGEAALASDAAVFTLTTGGGLNGAYDGSDALGRLDELYDATSGAFLVQSITLEALSGSSGQSTDIVLYVGDMAFSLDNLVETSYLTFGLGTNEVANNAVGETDGTAHAAISVAAQGPSALVMRAGVGTSVTVHRDAVVEERESTSIVRATAIPSIREDRRASLRAIDWAMESASDAQTTRRVLRGSRGVSRVAVDMDWIASGVA